MSGVAAKELLNEQGEVLGLVLVAGEAGLDRRVTVPRIQKPGLAFAGYLPQTHPERVQVVGSSELGFLATLAADDAARAVDRTFELGPACVIVTNGATAPPYFTTSANRHGVPLLATTRKSSELIHEVTAFLESRLAPQAQLHGVMVEVYGLGILLLGKSGIGKSEAALDLVSRGHRLVADDVVEARALGDGRILASGAELIRHHMEIRGLGIINVQDLFGILATLREKEIDLVAEMVEWRRDKAEDRLGLDDETYAILGTTLPKVRILIRPGRSVATIIEVAARNHVLRRLGRHTAREFAERLDGEIARRRSAHAAAPKQQARQRRG